MITRNTIDFNPAQVLECNEADWPDCGAGRIFAEYGISAPYDQPGGWAILTSDVLRARHLVG